MPAGGTGSSRNSTWGGPDLLLMGQPPGCPRFGVFATADIRILTRTSTGFPDRQMAGRENPGGQVFREFSHVSGNFCSGSREWQSIIFVPDPASYGTTLISCPALPCDNEHMQDTVGILEQLRGMRHDLEEQYHVKRIGIFGSYAKKAQTDESDLDLVVEFSRPIGMLAFVHLKDLLSRRLNLRIDLVTPDGLHPLIRDQVMHEVVYA